MAGIGTESGALLTREVDAAIILHQEHVLPIIAALDKLDNMMGGRNRGSQCVRYEA